MTKTDEFTLSNLIRSHHDPHGLYAALRSHDRIYFDSVSRTWLVTGHAEVVEILEDSRFSSELATADSAARSAKVSFFDVAVNKQIIFTDREIHRQVQQVVLRLLNRKTEDLPPVVEDLARSLVDKAASRQGFDLVDDFTGPFSLLVISRVLGVPTEDLDSLSRMARWSDTHGNVTSGYLHVDLTDVDRLGESFRELLAAKRSTPGDDLISLFDKESDLFTDDDELIANCMMVFGAGRMTTRKLLTQGIPLLASEWKKWREAYRSDPGIVKGLTEELLRYVTPTRYLLRHATEDVDLSRKFPGPHSIRRHDRVLLFLEAANRDPEIFGEPDHFDPRRRPNRHLAFGFGPHYCPGAKLARLEIQVALELLLSSFAELRPDPSAAPVWNPNPNLGGYASYRVLTR